MRKRRDIAKDAEYHVTARANRQEMILEEDQFKVLFLETVKQAKEKYSFSTRNFNIMGNHIHLIIKPLNDEKLSRIMQWILAVFAIKYNKIFGHKGHVWYDRFKSKIIRTIIQFIRTYFYIANNPVRANMVNHPLEHRYSGITFYKYGKKASLFYSLLDLPPKWFEKYIAKFIEEYDVEEGRRIKPVYSFRDKRPGRPRLRQESYGGQARKKK